MNLEVFIRQRPKTRDATRAVVAVAVRMRPGPPEGKAVV
jgi:hypothetical protein